MVKTVKRKENNVENYVNAELNVVTLASADTISSSVQIPSDENELPIDKS